MSTYSSDRRSLLKIIGAIGATCAYPFAGDELLGQTAEPHQHVAESTRTVTRFLNDADFATISRMAELIIPESDTPGADGAGVPDYIDFVLARNTDQQLLVADGLRWLDSEAARITAGSKFLKLSEEQQLSILLALCEMADAIPPYQTPPQMARVPRNVQFFALIKGLTADGYYTSRIGLINDLGYKGNKARPDFPGCSSKPSQEA